MVYVEAASLDSGMKNEALTMGIRRNTVPRGVKKVKEMS